TRLKTLAIAVMIPGAPYAEDSEVRRRTRYAVLSSLERTGFVPKDEHHLGYFRLSHNENRPPEMVPYEWFETKGADLQQKRYVLVLWVNEDALRGTPLRNLAALLAFLRPKISDASFGIPVRIVGPYSSNILLDMAREVGPQYGTCLPPVSLL